MWYIFTTDYYSAIKKTEIMLYAGKWMELEIIILSEISHGQKATHPMFSFVCGILV
jgi:hypothetical protein